MRLENRDVEFKHLDDNELVLLVQDGDIQALEFLIYKYRPFVRAKAKTYFLVGADHEDIAQEGMIGLYKAIRDFQKDKLSSFKAFAELCITRQIITAIKTATRKKHMPLNSYISLDKPLYENDSERTLVDVIEATIAMDPQELLVNRERYADMESKLAELLTDLERRVLLLYLEGKTYQEISSELDRHAKSIDNALQRVKKKLEKYLEESGIYIS
ncbi:RNA polymerase sporulation specific sigma factor SigH [Gracilibacillus boraciitolerans JCM 21714]|uniref:RNA polymerase sporulation specific sigma factor SigH n=1 Tax=Gracilibacillus boraciitolerans JCM 21714 TaxID=1298598 RepID=W4VLY0_9BACI|nr:RNA polymerase sporulation sigma factor SigH [Gracilibacillus boraciitolerans]GAE93774.1 RNA polymerase sporulation specific sigma factor SigH [Gracilibacillus boraciitolerans JCM 21714]